MDRHDTLEIKGIDKDCTLSYDPWTKDYIVGHNGILFSSPNKSHQQIPSDVGPEKPKIQAAPIKLKEFCPPESLRFVPNQKSQQLLISPSGLMVLSKQSSKSGENPLIYTNYGFSTGIHYWEILCPLSCTNLKIGVVKMEDKKLTVEEMNVFRTTTARTVGLLLDCEKKTLQFWLNGKEQTGRAKTLTDGYWLPAVRMSGIDNCVILNPYGQYPQFTVPYSCLTQAYSAEILNQDLESYFSNFFLVTQLKDNTQSTINTTTPILEEYIPKDTSTGKDYSVALVKVLDAEKFKKDAEEAKVPILGAEDMAKMLKLSEKTTHSDLLVKCIRVREEQGLIKANKAINGETFKNNLENPDEEINRCEYLPYTDKLLLMGKNSLKLISREDDEKIGFANKQGSIGSMRLFSVPKTLKDTVKLHLNLLEAQALIQKLNWAGLIEAYSPQASEHILAFLLTMTQSTAKKNEDLFISIAYFDAKKAVDLIMKAVLRSMSYFETSSSLLDTVQKRLAFHPLPSLPPIGTDPDPLKSLSLEDLNMLISILAKIDEQLWCITTSESCGDEIRALWDVRESRVHTAYGRLSSFLTWPSPGAISLAEAGLINIGDKRPQLQHFMETGIEVDNALTHDQKTRSEIWSILEKSFPNNRMLRGEPSINVPLSVTLRYMPPVVHTNPENEVQNINYFEQHPDSHFVLTGSEDGSVNIWNTRFRIFKALSTNFKKNPEAKVKPISVKSEAPETMFIGNLFDEDPANDVGEKIQLPPEEKPKTEEKKPEEVKKVVIPKQEFVDQMVAMGFNAEHAKKALIQVNNESLDLAMDAVLEIQKKEPIKVEEKKVEKQDYVIMSWHCPKCTLINIEGNKVCEVCMEPAPQSAYKYTQKKEEKKVIMPSPEKKAEKIIHEDSKKADEKNKDEERKLTENSKVCGFAMIIHNEYPAIPFTIACALCHEKGSFLRIRRFRYSKKYLQSFISPVTSGSNKGYISQITDLKINSTDDIDAKQHLFGECRDIVETYYPIYMKNQQRGDWLLEKTKIANNQIIISDELDIPLQYSKIYGISSVTLPIEKEHFILVLGQKGNDSPLTLSKISISSSCGEDSKLLAKVVGELEICPKVDEAKLLYDNNELSIIVTKEQINLIDITKFSIVSTIKESNSINNVQILSESEPYLNCYEITNILKSNDMNTPKPNKNKRRALVIINKDQVKRYWLTPNAENKVEEKQENTGALSALKIDYPDIKSNDLTIEDLTAYEQQMKATRIGSKAYNSENSLLISSKKEQESGYCSKHNWILCNPPKNIHEFILEPYKKTTLNHLSVSLTFTQEKVTDAKAASQSIPEKPKEESKNQENKDSPVKGLGLLSVHGGNGDSSSEEKRHHIPLIVASYKGAQYSFQNHVSRMLSDNPIMFASNYPKPQFVMCHQFGRKLFVDKFVVRSEINSICGGQPIGAGLVFIADSLSAFEHTAEFANITTSEQYKKWLEQRKLSPKPLQSYEPAGFFEMGNQTSITCDIDSKRPGYYIMLKPTIFRSIAGRPPMDFNLYPLEIQYFGVIGQVIDEELNDTVNIEHTKEIKDGQFATDYKMQVLVSENMKDWVQAAQINEKITIGELKTGIAPSDIDVQEVNLNIAKLIMPFNKYGGLYKAAIMDSRLQTIPAKYYKIVIEKSAGNSSWNLLSVNAEAYVACESEVKSKTLKELPTNYLRTCMGDVAFFNKINKAIVELSTKPDASPNLRLAACELLHKIIKTYPPQAIPIAKNIALDDFIHLNIYQREKLTVTMAVDLLQQLSIVPEFCKNVHKIILQDISVIPSFKLSQAGISLYIYMGFG